MSSVKIDEIVEFASSLAIEAGKKIQQVFESGQSSLVELKSSPVDLVTETDQQVEKLIIAKIKSQYPDHHFIGEESVADGAKCNLTDAPTWIVDPIDGTTNFVHRVPKVAICLGFCVGKLPVAGVVYNPITCQMFTAIKGKGAYCNGKQLKVSDQQNLTKSIIMTEFGSSREKEKMDKIFSNLNSVVTTPVHGIRSFGSAAINMCQVASGVAEAYYEFGIHCWDYCAASVIVREAGGVCIDTQGGDLQLMSRRVIAACNTDIATSLCSRIIHQVEFARD